VFACYWRIIFALLAGLVAVGPASVPSHADPSHLHALLIGISDYRHFHQSDNPPLFPNLDCNEDLRRIEAALVSTFRFKANPADKTQFDPAAGEATVLNTPEQTTRAAILTAFDHLVAVSQPGDLVYIHYSGHGSQVPDSTKPEGLESTIVPSDYKDDESNEIKGVEIKQLLTDLKAKVGDGQIVLSFDSCHSGTISRGSERKRGISYAEYCDWFKAKYKKDPPLLARPATTTATRGAGLAIPDLDGNGYVVLSACSNDQSAYEYDDGGIAMGRLSYVLSQVLSQAKPTTTYQEVYDDIEAVFTQKFADQSPQIDGDPNSYLLGGAAKEPPTSLLVSVAASGRPDQYVVDAGSLQGMTMGSEFGIYAKDAQSFMSDQELAKAKITKLNLTSAEIAVLTTYKPGLTRESFQGAHAVEIAHNYASPPLTLDPASVTQVVPAQAQAILAKLADPQTGLNMVRTTLLAGEKPDIVMRRAEGKPRGTAEVDLVRSDTGAVISSVDETQDMPGEVFSSLQKYARYCYAVGLGVSQAGLNSAYHVALRIVPADVKEDADGHTLFDHDKTDAAGSSLQIGDHFTIDVQNTGDSPVFLTVLDLDSNGDISQPWPSPSSTTQDNIILPTKPDQWVKLWVGSDKGHIAVFKATSADPHEIYKAIATANYVSFKALRTRGANRGPESPFSDLFGPAVDEGTRGTSGDDNVDPGSWTAFTYPFAVHG
jgi:hypothetical protein